MFITSEDKQKFMDLLVKVLGQDPPQRSADSYLLEAKEIEERVQTIQKGQLQRLLFDNSIEVAKVMLATPGRTFVGTDEKEMGISCAAWMVVTNLAIKAGICIPEEENEKEDN